jgi:hypothetical protein
MLALNVNKSIVKVRLGNFRGINALNVNKSTDVWITSEKSKTRNAEIQQRKKFAKSLQTTSRYWQIFML